MSSPADTRARWRRSFGLSHGELRKGGNDLCQGSGDLAELVFTARSGQGVRRVLEQIDREADALFKGHRNNKDVKVRQAHTTYLAAVAQVREMTAAGHIVRAIRDDRERAEREVAAAGTAAAA